MHLKKIITSNKSLEIIENKNGGFLSNNNFDKSIDYRKCILFVIGTRPEEIKSFHLLETARNASIPTLVAFTGQHKNLVNRKKYNFLFN